MPTPTVSCPIHGAQGVGLVCVHIARAIDHGDRVGFFWSPPTDTARPDAWCALCEESFVADDEASRASWVTRADFKVFCARCWDEAKSICGSVENV